MAEHEATIRIVLAKYGRLAVDVIDLTEQDNLYEAGMTSHASVNVMMAIEDHYEMEFPEELIQRETFESIANLSAALAESLQV